MKNLRKVFKIFKPDIVFHLAGQPEYYILLKIQIFIKLIIFMPQEIFAKLLENLKLKNLYLHHQVQFMVIKKIFQLKKTLN